MALSGTIPSVSTAAAHAAIAMRLLVRVEWAGQRGCIDLPLALGCQRRRGAAQLDGADDDSAARVTAPLSTHDRCASGACRSLQPISSVRSDARNPTWIQTVTQ